MAVNDQYRGEFMPGISAGVPNNAPGTPGASGDAADDEGAGRITLQGVGAWQPGARYPAATGGTVLPDQTATSPIVPGPQSGLTSTGAGRGSGEHYPRRPGQEGGA